jgi:phosphoglycolate phosphatase-like HAD superfamily hydrolase
MRDPSSADTARLLLLFDVDNTLLDNDRIAADLREYLTREVGRGRQEQYWRIFEELRAELGYADYLGALQRYRIQHPREPHLLAISSYLVNYPFADRLFPGALDVLKHVRAFGPTVILSDGDVVFQPLKVERSGLSEAVEGRVLIYIHKEAELDDVERRHPAAHYVLVDDKVRILAAVKERWGERLTTVFPRQGHYAHGPDVARHPAPDLAIDRIADLMKYDATSLRDAARRKGAR